MNKTTEIINSFLSEEEDEESRSKLKTAAGVAGGIAVGVISTAAAIALARKYKRYKIRANILKMDNSPEFKETMEEIFKIQNQLNNMFVRKKSGRIVKAWTFVKNFIKGK